MSLQLYCQTDTQKQRGCRHCPHHRELVVLGKGSVPFPVCKVHPQLRWVATQVSQEVHVVQLKPVFTVKVAKASFVVSLVAIKIYAAILSLQQYHPTSSICVHVAVYIESFIAVIWLNGVHTTLVGPFHLCIITVGCTSCVYQIEWLG